MTYLNKLFTIIAPILERKEKDRSHLLELIPKNSVCAEIGVWKGSFSLEILNKVNPRKLHLIDPWKFMPAYSDRWYGGTIAKEQKDMDEIYESVLGKFKKNRNVFIHRNLSEKVVGKFKNDYFDFVYIDADHSYEFVKKDLDNFYAKVKKGGIIAGDDYYSLFSLIHGFGVKKAVDEFLKEKPLKNLSTGGQFILRKI